ncbi:hypothetical protein ERHA55_51920 (plasmid) [Erwinia rhapontici]|nr:hypothetical protein ERHA55_51920 [Erwinia rhapontici]
MQVADTRSFVSAGRQLGSRLQQWEKMWHAWRKNSVCACSTAVPQHYPDSGRALFLERCRRILAEVEAAQLELSQASGKPAGRLRISLRWSVR